VRLELGGRGGKPHAAPSAGRISPATTLDAQAEIHWFRPGYGRGHRSAISLPLFIAPPERETFADAASRNFDPEKAAGIRKWQRKDLEQARTNGGRQDRCPD
jgi:hypothetical protein